ncbi:MAG: hypothetical protein P4N59_11395, partial [Negativicutes bacterium]|nr:hypothetical protein [Negativicutes bacterium]
IFAAQAPPVTDAALTKALQDHNAVVKNPVAIRELIGQFVAPPGQASDIPQARRPEFITKLKLIGPKAG